MKDIKNENNINKNWKNQPTVYLRLFKAPQSNVTTFPKSNVGMNHIRIGGTGRKATTIFVFLSTNIL